MINEETKYQKFFKKALKKFGVSSPAELSGEKEKEFYDYVDNTWTGEKNESFNDMIRRIIREEIEIYKLDL